MMQMKDSELLGCLLRSLGGDVPQVFRFIALLASVHDSLEINWLARTPRSGNDLRPFIVGGVKSPISFHGELKVCMSLCVVP